MKHDWCVYVLKCGDGSLYTGITKDILVRWREHVTGKGAKYTRAHKPVDLAYFQAQLTHSEALQLEARIKKMRHKEKLKFCTFTKERGMTWV